MKVDSANQLGESFAPALLGTRRILECLRNVLNLEIPVFRAVFAPGDIDETLT